MNRILFEASQRADDGTVTLQGAEAHHIVTVLKAVPGNLLRLGEVDGLRYDEAEVLEVRAAEGVVRVRPGAGRRGQTRPSRSPARSRCGTGGSRPSAAA